MNQAAPLTQRGAPAAEYKPFGAPREEFPEGARPWEIR